MNRPATDAGDAAIMKSMESGKNARTSSTLENYLAVAYGTTLIVWALRSIQEFFVAVWLIFLLLMLGVLIMRKNR